MKTIRLECKDIEYLSAIDEDQFFGWLDKIECIDDITGIGDTLYLTINSEFSDENLREIIALFSRYQVEMTQLQKLLTDDNRHWFYENKESYWQDDVFCT